MGRIYIVRHGNTFDKGDVVTRVGARTNLPLSKSGKAQAESLSHHFKAHKFGRSYCSTLKRTQQTLDAILKRHKVSSTALTFLNEIDYGPDENRPEDEVIARLGADAIQLWDDNAIPPDGWLVYPDEIKQGWADFFAAHADYTDDTLLVTSNGTARFALDIARPIIPFARKLKTGAYGIIEFQNGYPVTTAWNIRPDQ